MSVTCDANILMPKTYTLSVVRGAKPVIVLSFLCNKENIQANRYVDKSN
jgi:hypothetical protein